MAESEKRRREKKPGGKKSPPRPGKNSEGTKRKDGPPGADGIKPQLAGGLGPGGPSGVPTAVEPPPSPSPPPPAGPGMPPGMPPGPPDVAGAASMATGGAPLPGALPGTVPPQTTGAAPNTLGPGFPDDLQGTPNDQQQLLKVMQTGFGPGASQTDFDAGMAAASQVRAMEHQMMQQAFSQNEDQMEIQELGRLMAAILRRRSGQGNPAPTADRAGLPL